MTDPIPRRRAPAMSPADRRAAIIRATLPLLLKDGVNVSTGQIAQAAEIAEGTIFRVFNDKQELIRDCVQTAFQSDTLVAGLGAIPADAALADRLEQGMALLADWSREFGTLMHALFASGFQPPTPPSMADRQAFFTERMAPVHAAFTRLLGPAPLRIPTEQAVSYLMALAMNRHPCPGAHPEPPDHTQTVSLFLHGALDHEQEDRTR